MKPPHGPLLGLEDSSCQIENPFRPIEAIAGHRGKRLFFLAMSRQRAIAGAKQQRHGFVFQSVGLLEAVDLAPCDAMPNLLDDSGHLTTWYMPFVFLSSPRQGLPFLRDGAA